MSEVKTIKWKGASGTFYTYFIYELPITFTDNQDGNYIYAKLVDNNWRPIYIGEGDLGRRIRPTHHKAACISSKGATHVHVHLNANETERISEENDLLENYTQVFSPLGCNEK